MTTLQRTTKHSRIKLKNWFVLVTFVASSEELIIPLKPVTLLDLTTDALPTTFATTDALPNPLTRTLNWLAPMLPLPTLPYVALSTPSLLVSLVEAPPPLQKETPPPYPIHQPYYPFPSQTSHASHHLHGRQLSRPRPPTRRPHGHHY